MRRLPLVLLLALAGCGGGDAAPEEVVRAWSRAVNAGDDAAAAKLFAPGASVVQAGRARRLDTLADARRWNAGLPCSGEIVELVSTGDRVTATFVLGDRRRSRCDGPGERARALFRVRDGKIVLWHQLASPELDEESA